MSARPAVQASYMKNLFELLAAQGRLAAVEQAAPELVREVAAASRASWLPVELNVRMVEVMAEHFGEERGIELLADCVYQQFGTPLWKGFIGGAIRLLGTDPGSLGRWIPEAMKLVFRDCGRFSAEPSADDELTVRVDELPPPLTGHGPWLRSLATGMTPLFTLCGRDGSARLAEVDETGRSARYVLHWKPAP